MQHPTERFGAKGVNKRVVKMPTSNTAPKYNFSINNRLKSSIKPTGVQWRREGGGGTPERSPPPETGKIVVEIWCYLPEVYTFGAESEIQEIFSKKL